MSDLISRQAAIDALGEEPEVWNDTDEEIAARNQWQADMEAIKAVLSAEPKKGMWNFEEHPDGYYHAECSECGQWFEESAYLKPYNYCPNCGSDMREE